jgi:SAM-dependent methyltransferase
MTQEVDPRLLRLPFDQYQRYRIATDLISELSVGAGERVLDVGGGPGVVEQFLPRHETFIVDLEGPFHGRFVQASGAQLPFPSRAFGAVVALDTLEHVPPSDRGEFLHELARVADVVVVSAPFASEEVRLAESALDEFVTQRFGGFATLEEHAEHGLPELDASAQALSCEGLAVALLPSGFLPRWLIGMLVHHELLATGVTEVSELHAYYNATVSPLDCREPSYRHVIVAARGVSADELATIVGAHRSDGDSAEGRALLNSVVATVFAQRVSGVLRSAEMTQLQQELVATHEKNAILERVVADRDARLTAADQERDRLVEERDRLADENRQLRESVTNRMISKVRRTIGSDG